MCGCCSRVRMCPPREVSRLPFLDTDIARGLFLLTIDDFFFFWNEFGIDAFRPACAMEGSSTDQYYVCLCKHTDVTAVINRPLSDPSPGDTSFSSHLQDVLERSMDLLKTSRRTLYFINCQTLFDRSQHTRLLTLSHTPFKQFLERLAFLASQLAHRDERHGVLFCCSMVWEGKVDGEASIKVVREACEGWAGSAAAIDSLWNSLPDYGPSWEAPPDEGVSSSRGWMMHVWRLLLSDLGLVSAAAKCTAVQCNSLCRGWVDGICVEVCCCGGIMAPLRAKDKMCIWVLVD
ncbi:unnamed protein product [Vitrella brassicaformis CCMP3155]|uniref:Uncharacterized protein n=1 Tax=Vitrella brassicaformis (strain CCMP3155) TaxID=1169540 RepID=A0A0G4H665_VITBC|nr:unnamed protein product [Vitrella brassicaformis CCMP3155]|eukprot:CEM39347.1 unnamed protein product [Vitrella brassicaformis CCMP3155]